MKFLVINSSSVNISLNTMGVNFGVSETSKFRKRNCSSVSFALNMIWVNFGVIEVAVHQLTSVWIRSELISVSVNFEVFVEKLFICQCWFECDVSSGVKQWSFSLETVHPLSALLWISVWNMEVSVLYDGKTALQSLLLWIRLYGFRCPTA